VTHSTKTIYMLLLSDYVKVSFLKASIEDMLYDEINYICSIDKLQASYIREY
jgi:hypothetical protein